MAIISPMKNTRWKRHSVVIDKDLADRLQKMAKARDGDPLRKISISELIRAGMRYWIEKGAPMPAER